MGEATPSWRPLGRVAPTDLVDARLQAHWAAQVVGAVPFNYREPKDDDSHTSLGWNGTDGSLEALPVGEDPSLTVGLRFDPFALAIRDRDRAIVGEMPLRGRTLDEAYTWAATVLRDQSSTAFVRDHLDRRDYDMPRHPSGEDSPFDPDRVAIGELARWYGNTAVLLESLAASEEGASPLRCWPHHFDLATLIVLEAGSGHDDMKSVGVGLSPGDANYEEPYLYVSPWPYPQDAILLDLPSGHWHREGFTAAILTGTELLSGDHDQALQRERAESFFAAAISAAKTVLGTA